MGQAMTSETLSISGGDGHRYWVGLTLKPFKVGCKKTMYKGVLIGNGPREWEKVVVKAFTDIPGTKEIWTHEVNKADITKQLAARFAQDCSPDCKIKVVVPGIVQMDKVSNLTKWLAGRRGGRGLTGEEWLSVEELLPGKISRFCPWSSTHNDHVDSDCLTTFSHFTFKFTNGALVACDFQGICKNKGNSTPSYVFTDSIIHSTTKMYGMFDKGEYGITEFFKFHKCTNICKDWPKPTPLTPPPSFDDACLVHFNLTPPPSFENIVFPAHSSEHGQDQQGGSTSTPVLSRRRHASEHHTRQRSAHGTPRNTGSLHVDWQGMRRRSNSNTGIDDQGHDEREVLCPLPINNNLLHVSSAVQTPPPTYDSVCGPSFQTQTCSSHASNGSVSQGNDQSREDRNTSNNVQLQQLPSASRSPIMRHVGGSLKQLRRHEEIDQTRSPPRSATDPTLEIGHDRRYRDRSYSDNSNSSGLYHRRILNQEGVGEGNDTPVFFCLGTNPSLPLPPKTVPSAPPLEDADT